MRIFSFARRYPIPYKPYYDAQFADLVRQGHDLTIFSGGRLDDVENETVARYGLAQRTVHFPMTLRDLPRHAAGLAAAALTDPGRSARALRVASQTVRRPDRPVVHAP